MLISAEPDESRHRLGRRESVALLAGLMAMNAIGIDAMVPALPQIGHSLGVTSENERQFVVIFYMFGFGIGQLFWGPIADRFGRRGVIAAGVCTYALFCLVCAVAATFPMLIAARTLMGAAAASTRVLVTAMVRDLFEGEEMAQVMSLVFMVFILVPVLAPSIGQLILAVSHWQAIFFALTAYAALLLVWLLLRLPETLHSDYRRALDASAILSAARIFGRDRLAVGYTLASSALFGALSAYIASIQQIVADVFHAPEHLGLVFGAIAAPMALASWANSRIVGRFGLRRVGHSGLAVVLLVSIVHLAVAASGHEALPEFIAFQAATFVAFAFCGSNFGTLAMVNMGEIAGTASSIQGVVSTIVGALIGMIIGQAFNGTVLPFLIGMTLCAAVSILLVGLTERGRLWKPLAA